MPSPEIPASERGRLAAQEADKMEDIASEVLSRLNQSNAKPKESKNWDLVPSREESLLIMSPSPTQLKLAIDSEMGQSQSVT